MIYILFQRQRSLLKNDISVVLCFAFPGNTPWAMRNNTNFLWLEALHGLQPPLFSFFEFNSYPLNVLIYLKLKEDASVCSKRGFE